MTVRAGRVENRQVVPRWRSFADTVRTRELRPLVERGEIPGDREIARAIARAQIRPSSYATAELVSVLLARGDVEAAQELGNEVDEKFPETLQRVAERLMRANVIESRLADDPKSFNPTAFAKSLGAEARARLRLRPNNPTAWVDLALAHIVQGFDARAEREIRFALQLAPDNRFVLRAAARLYVHIDDPEQANYVLNESGRLHDDPWLLAAEISTSQLAFGRAKNLVRARSLVEFSDASPYAKSELLSELATAEIQSGRDAKARQLFRRSFVDPTENAVAQAASWADRGRVELEPRLLKIDRVYEARALENARLGQWAKATQEATAWHQDQPFSVEPYWLATYTAALGSGDFEVGARIAIEGLERHREDRTLRNNAAYSLANLGRTVEAREYAGNPLHLDTVDDLTDLATRGLIHFRELDVDGGSSRYQGAIDGFIRLRRPDLAAIALMHWAMEECRLRLTTASAVVRRARRAVPDIPPAEREALILRMERILQERPATPKRPFTE